MGYRLEPIVLCMQLHIFFILEQFVMLLGRLNLKLLAKPFTVFEYGPKYYLCYLALELDWACAELCNESE
jgi:hypothetical protein